ncbi:Protein FAM185A [Merluccius polli]|uniref:Protein FAM185A n=1 Tax=Merluccius polli TaxID=89951 RepID=A0AA47NX08_MERPO|nr:Protein FAM185A [Merluccius polli]
MLWCGAAGRCVARRLITARPLVTVGPGRGTTSRSFSVSPCRCSDVTGPRPVQVLGQWDFVVSPFCGVRARAGGCCVAVRSPDPHASPTADRTLVVLYGSGSGVDPNSSHVNVSYDGRNRELSILADRVTGSSDVTVEVTTSIKSNVDIVTHGAGDVRVHNMESDVCKVRTERGCCVLQSVKGHEVEVQSDGGHVTGVGTIHGNVTITTSGDGAVDVKKLQGTVMHVSTERGTLKVKAIYAESTSISSSSGTVELGHLHGDATVKNVSGDVIITGTLTCTWGQSGSAEVFSQSGAVCVRVPSSLRAGVDLVGTSVEVSPEVTLQEAKHNTTGGQTQVTGYVNGNPGTAQMIKAEAAQGVVSLKTQSWFESLRLQGS